MERVIIDDNIHLQFETNGFVVLDIFDAEDISNLKSIFEYYLKNLPITDFASTTILPEHTNIEISSKIAEVIRPKLTKYFKNFDVLGGSFLIKSSTNGSLGLHQDSTFTDFQKFQAGFCWTPLEDVDIHNGCMYVIKGSHKFFDNIVSFSYRNENIFRRKIPKKHILPIKMTVGQVLFFNPSLFHGSFKTTSNKQRIAINSIVTPSDAPIYYYNRLNDNSLAYYKIPLMSFLNSYKYFINNELPLNAQYIANKHYQHQKISELELYKVLTNKPYPILKRLYYHFFRKSINEYK